MRGMYLSEVRHCGIQLEQINPTNAPRKPMSWGVCLIPWAIMVCVWLVTK